MKRSVFVFIVIVQFLGFNVSSLQAQRVGWWNFNDVSNLTAPVAGYGQPLVLTGTHQLANGPEANDYAVKIGVGSYYKMTHGIGANGGGSYINEYSLQIDFKVASVNVWHSFFQTTPQNNNDADFFINPSGQLGVAAVGYSPQSINAGEWYRLVISVDNGTSFNVYLDGELIMQGAVQDVDGRFALANALLLFADEDAEDNDIYVSEVGIWDYNLSPFEVEALGGFSHILPPAGQLILHPFIQSLSTNSVYVCWHDPQTTNTTVEYGLTEALGSAASGTNEIVAANYRWHNVKLTNLQANTKYYYRLVSGSGTSAVFDFTTIPDADYQGHIRFLLFSDTQDDSAATGFVVRSARDKMLQLFGENFTDSIQLMMHTGDIVGSGSTITQWTDEFLRPFSPLTTGIPFMSVAGNHELEHQNYYKYIKYDDFSAFPSGHALFEKVWSYRMPGTLFIGLNTNMINNFGNTQKTWLDTKLAEAQQDNSIHFVFCFLHHPPMSELWGEGNTAYVHDEILPILKKYSKVQQLSYGHTHAYERGVIKSDTDLGDFRISCVGGGGGNRDRWGEYTNTDYPEIHIALDHYFYVMYDINLGDLSYTGQMYDLGNTNVTATNEIADSWHRRLNQSPPAKPTLLDIANQPDLSLLLQANNFIGEDDCMSSQFQISNMSGNFSQPLLDKSTNWQNIYLVTNSFEPIDRNAGIDLSQCKVPHGQLENGKIYYARMRYRDQNLRWSAWSDEKSFVYLDPQGLDENSGDGSFLYQNKPNPFTTETHIRFVLTQPREVMLVINDLKGHRVATILDEKLSAGNFDVPFNGSQLEEGVYYYQLITDDYSVTRKMLIVK